MIAGLLRIVAMTPADLPNREAKLFAIDLLGEYRETEAADALAEEIDYLPPTSVIVGENIENAYPCVRVGEDRSASGARRLSAARGAFPERVSDKHVDLYAHALLEIYGRDMGGHKELIGMVDRTTTRAKEKHNLSRLSTTLREKTKGWQ